MQKIMENCFGTERAGRIQYFPLGGRITFAELTPLHRFFMRLGSKLEKDPRISAEMLEDKDLVDRSSLNSILGYINR